MKVVRNKKNHLQAQEKNETEKRMEVFSTSNLVGSALILLVISLLVAVVDNTLIKPNAIWVLGSYDAILIAFWSTQVTFSTLTIAFLAIFTNRLNERFYGYSVKELLAMNKNCFRLNFFECILMVFLLDGITAIPVVFVSMNAVAIMMMIQMWLVFNVIKMSLLVTMDEMHARNLAKGYVENAMQFVLSEIEQAKNSGDLPQNNVQALNGEDTKPVSINENELIKIIEKITVQLKCKLTPGSSIFLRKDEDFLFIEKVICTCSENEYICNVCRNEILSLLYEALQTERYKVAIDLSQRLMSYSSSDQARVAAQVICDQYYSGKLPSLLFDEWSKSVEALVAQKLPRSLEICLQVQFEYTKNADSQRFYELCAGVTSYRFYQNNLCVANFFHVMAAYAYYLSWKEPLYSKLYGAEKLKVLKKLMKTGVLVGNNVSKVSDLLSNQDFLIGIVEVFHLIPQRYKGYGAFGFQELHDFSQVYTVHTENDVQEYVAFALFSIYRNKSEILRELSYGDLLIIKRYITNKGAIEIKYKQAYIHFNDWLGWEVKKKNEVLIMDLHKALKEKAFEQIKTIRSDTEDFEKRFDVLKETLILTWKKYSFGKGVPDGQMEKCSVAISNRIYPSIKGFTFGGLEKEILSHLYISAITYNQKQLKTLSIDDTADRSQNKQSMADLFCELHEFNDELTFNRIYGERLSEILIPSELEEIALKQTPLFDKNILLDDILPELQPRTAIYINSSIFSPSVFLNDDSITFQDYLDDKEIEKIVLDNFEKEKGYYITFVDIQVPCSYEEAYQYIKETTCKIVCHADVAIATELFGVCVEVI